MNTSTELMKTCPSNKCSLSGKFHHITVATEWSKDYHPDSLHPIHIGNSLNGDWYKSIENLAMALFPPDGWQGTPSPLVLVLGFTTK